MYDTTLALRFLFDRYVFDLGTIPVRFNSHSLHFDGTGGGTIALGGGAVRAPGRRRRLQGRGFLGRLGDRLLDAVGVGVTGRVDGGERRLLAGRGRDRFAAFD